MMRKIGIIGLGKLGKSLYDVLALNTNSNVWYFDKVVNTNYEFMGLTEMVVNCDAIFICVDTPEEDKFSGSHFYDIENIVEFDYDYTNVRSIMSELNQFTGLTIISSTISPLEIKEICLRYNHLNIIYNPFMFEGGNEYESIKNQENVIIGYEREVDGVNSLIELYKKFSNPEFHVMGVVDASFLKMLHNSYVSLRIGFTNSVQRVTNTLGSNPQLILNSLKKFPIFNKPKFLNIGPSSGGPCIPRDSLVMSKILPNDGLLKENLKNRMSHMEWISDRVISLMNSTNKNGISLMGISYKRGVESQKGSPAVLLKESLENKNIKCVVDEEDVNRLTVLINSDQSLKVPYYDIWKDKLIESYDE